MAINLKGGRGQKAPYEITHVRVPKPIKALVESIVASYKEQLENYEDPEDPDLIAATMAGLLGEDAQITATLRQQLKNLVDSWTATEREIERLREQVKLLEESQDSHSVNQVIVDFIEHEKSLFGMSSSQKGKTFTLETRRWDAFRYFVKFAALPRKADGWNIGDNCKLKSPTTQQEVTGKIRAFKSDRSKVEICLDLDGSSIQTNIETLERL